MKESDDEKTGWKPSGAAMAALIVGALMLAGLTCWVLNINPLPTTGHVLDSGWLLTIALVYFFVLYFAVARIRRGR
jgi:hypothetical protein